MATTTYNEDTLARIEELKEDYSMEEIHDVLDTFGEDWTLMQLQDILDTEDKDALYEFLQQYGNDSVEYYEKFVDLCDDYDEDAVKAFIECMGIDSLPNFEESYYGEFDTVGDFVDEVMESMGTEIPSWVYIDYESTWISSLRHDYVRENGYYFRRI